MGISKTVLQVPDHQPYETGLRQCRNRLLVNDGRLKLPGISFYVLGSRYIGHLEVKTSEEKDPLRLLRIQAFFQLEIFQVPIVS